MLIVTDKHAELRGEMHQLFEQISSSKDQEAFEIRLKNIWDTWAIIEASMPNN